MAEEIKEEINKDIKESETTEEFVARIEKKIEDKKSEPEKKYDYLMKLKGEKETKETKRVEGLPKKLEEATSNFEIALEDLRDSNPVKKYNLNRVEQERLSPFIAELVKTRGQVKGAKRKAAMKESLKGHREFSKEHIKDLQEKRTEQMKKEPAISSEQRSFLEKKGLLKSKDKTAESESQFE